MKRAQYSKYYTGTPPPLSELGAGIEGAGGVEAGGGEEAGILR